MSGTRRTAFVAAMLCYLSGAALLLTAYEAPMDVDELEATSDGDPVRFRGEASPFHDARLQEWQDDDDMIRLQSVAPFTVVVKSDEPLPKEGSWVVQGTLDHRIRLDGRLHFLIDADDVTAPLFAA